MSGDSKFLFSFSVIVLLLFLFESVCGSFAFFTFVPHHCLDMFTG